MEIKIVKKLLEENDGQANQLRKALSEKKQLMINFMSSPGSGKTTLLEALIPNLQSMKIRIGVIQGDIATLSDSQRLEHFDIPIVQINTDRFGGECHLSAASVMSALELMPPHSNQIDLILLENIGNLVCPAEFDTGAHINIVVLSLAEGEDKPEKYPLAFRKADIVILNKIDLAEICEVEIALFHANVKKINPRVQIFETSAKKDVGITSVAQKIQSALMEIR